MSVAKALISGKSVFKPSQNDYDWLGEGMYFWENNKERAFEYAKESIKRNKGQEKPAVVGAVLTLGYCFNLLEKHHLDALKETYEFLKESSLKLDIELPQNYGGDDNLLRNLDCAVIQTHHALNEQFNNQQAFDSVRGVFQEGGPVYPGAGFREKSHIQIAIRNPNCIKGFFWPRELDSKFSRA